MATTGNLNELNPAKAQDGNNGQFEGVESQLFELNKRVKHLEFKLQETMAKFKTKEQKARELELLLGNTNLPKLEGTSAHLSSLRERKEEAGSELEVLLTKKMEAEIEYLILTRTPPNWKVSSEDHIALLNELRHLAGDQEQMMLNLRVAEDETIKLCERTDELGAYSKELIGTEHVLRLHHMVCKFSLYLIFQLMLLCIAFGLFLMKLVFPANGVAPT